MHYVCFHYEFEHSGDVDRECSAGGCPSRRVDLTSSLAAWTDWDMASFRLGRALGVVGGSEPERVDATYWAANPWSGTLHDALDSLVAAGLLERRDEPEVGFRWANRDRP
jgi:hypothetical protein